MKYNFPLNRYNLQTEEVIMTPSHHQPIVSIAKLHEGSRRLALASNCTKIVNSSAFSFKSVCARFERNKSGDNIRAGTAVGAEEFGEEIAVIICSLPKAIVNECFLYVHVLTPETLVRYSSGFRHRSDSIGSMAAKSCTCTY